MGQRRAAYIAFTLLGPGYRTQATSLPDLARIGGPVGLSIITARLARNEALSPHMIDPDLILSDPILSTITGASTDQGTT